MAAVNGALSPLLVTLHIAAQLLPSFFFCATKIWVHLRRSVAQFTLQLQIAAPARVVNFTGRARFLYGAPRLRCVGTIAESTDGCQGVNLRESLIHCGGLGMMPTSLPRILRPQLQFTDSGIVQNQSAVGQKEQLPMRCGVASAAVRLARRLRRLRSFSQELIDD